MTLSGGNLIYTNASSSNATVCVPFRGGSSVGGPNFSQGRVTINSGSTAIIDRVQFGEAVVSESRAQCTGTINLNAGGTLATRYIRGMDNDADQVAGIFNFNGGTLRVFGTIPVAGLSFLADAGTNRTVNVQSGGAMIDTAGISATITNRCWMQVVPVVSLKTAMALTRRPPLWIRRTNGKRPVWAQIRCPCCCRP